MDRTGQRRLRRLIALMRTVPRARFDMRNFFGGVDSIADLGRCGTTACAAGWACTVPAFQRAGLRLSHRGVPYVALGELRNFDALARFFRADRELVILTLFLPPTNARGNETPRGWARRAERYLAKLEAPP